MHTISQFNYNGPSMKPLLKPGDGLIVDPNIPFTFLRRGDVICFKSPERPIHVTHRVITTTRKGLITRGDNNTQSDPYMVTPELDPMLLLHILRGRKRIKIHCGILGMMIHHKNQIRCFILRRMVSPLLLILNDTFRFMRRISCLCHLRLIEKHVYVFSFIHNRKEVQMLFAWQHRIAHLKANGAWYLRIPWRLFVDPLKIQHNRKKAHASFKNRIR